MKSKSEQTALRVKRHMWCTPEQTSHIATQWEISIDIESKCGVRTFIIIPLYNHKTPVWICIKKNPHKIS